MDKDRENKHLGRDDDDDDDDDDDPCLNVTQLLAQQWEIWRIERKYSGIVWTIVRPPYFFVVHCIGNWAKRRDTEVECFVGSRRTTGWGKQNPSRVPTFLTWLTIALSSSFWEKICLRESFLFCMHFLLLVNPLIFVVWEGVNVWDKLAFVWTKQNCLYTKKRFW